MIRPLALARVVAGELRAGRPTSAAAELVAGTLARLTCRLFNRHTAGCRGRRRCLDRGGHWPAHAWF